MTAEFLQTIFSMYGTDKVQHGYAEYYAKHLPKTAKKILEVGVLKGSSILAWHEIYPESHIFGLDLFQENPIPFQENWVTWISGSQTDGKLLGHVRAHGPFDFIIEDASHNSRDTLMTFYGLVDCSPLYIIEDLHCSNEEFYRQGMKYEHTTLGQMLWRKFAFKFDLYDSKIAFIYP